MSAEIIKDIKKLKNAGVSPDKAWVAKNRELLLCQVKNTVVKEKTGFSVSNLWPAMSIFMPQRLVYGVVRPVMAMLLIIGITSSGWIATVDASYNALPGDWTYPAKRATEKTKIAVASIIGSKQTETKYHAEAAKQRAQEIKQIVNGTDQTKKEKVPQAISDLREEINQMDKKLEEIKTDPSQTQSDEMVVNIKQETNNIKLSLKEAQTNLLVSDQNEDKILSQSISETNSEVKAVEVKAVEVAVAKHLEGDTSVTSQEVVDMIGVALQDAVQEVEVSKQSVVEAGKVMEGVKNAKDSLNTTSTVLLDGATSTASIKLIVNTTTLAQAQIDNNLKEKIVTVSTQTQEASVKTQEVAGRMDEKVNEIKGLLQAGTLENVVEKMKEVNVVVKEAGDLSAKTLANVSEAFPVVKVVKEETKVGEAVVVPEKNTSTTNAEKITTTTEATTTVKK